MLPACFQAGVPFVGVLVSVNVSDGLEYHCPAVIGFRLMWHGTGNKQVFLECG